MTGEVTLSGQVLPIGGLKEKTLAAQRAGIHTVILPSRNEIDLDEVPEHLRKDMKFVPVDRVEQVWRAAMGLRIGNGAARPGEPVKPAGRPAARRRKPAVPQAVPVAAPPRGPNAAADAKRGTAARGRSGRRR